MSVKSTKDEPVFLRREMNVVNADGVILLDAVLRSDGDQRTVQLFFKSGPSAEQFQAGHNLEFGLLRSIGGATMVNGKMTGSGDTVGVVVDDTVVEITPNLPETELFAGLNVCFGVRNEETAEVTLGWLRHHATFHRMTGALILSRSKPGEDEMYAAELQQGIDAIDGLKRVVLLEADTPLGEPDLPPEAHPYNVFGAPGKDRMELPENDLWKAPLGEVLIYELARSRFLNEARAIANIDIYDLLVRDHPQNIFDRAVAAESGYVLLEGLQCYPWRIRKNREPAFGDHICVQFDIEKTRRRWCIAPAVTGENTVWRLIRVVGVTPAENDTASFRRYMALRHPTGSVSKIVPKSSLVEDAYLITQAETEFAHKPVRMPHEVLASHKSGPAQTTVVTAMKNEGPFILEWIAYHRVIGVTNFLVYTNDCTDGTDTMLQLLQDKGILQHRENPFRESELKPQQAALKAANSEAVVKNADWLICMDVDEYINIHAGDGKLADLFKAVGDANMIAITWRLFGNADIHEYEDRPLCELYDRCAPELARKPHQAWGFKTLYRNIGIFKKLGVHRPKGLKPQHWEAINWVNGSGKLIPNSMFRNAWRSTLTTYGYELVTLNHYAVRSAESFLVKRDRGRVNHVDRDQGLAYWFRMNNNAEEDKSIQRMIPELRIEIDRLMSDPDIAAAHEYCVRKHREKIAELRQPERFGPFLEELTGYRMQRLSRLHTHFGANVFLSGPNSVPDEILEQDLSPNFTFTTKKGTTEH